MPSALGRLHEQHIVEGLAQSPQSVADGRLRQMQRLRRAGRVPGPVEHVEGQQEIEVDVAQLGVLRHGGPVLRL
jgi:hypothetical protein